MLWVLLSFRLTFGGRALQSNAHLVELVLRLELILSKWMMTWVAREPVKEWCCGISWPESY